MEQVITFEVSKQEAVAILTVLGQMPTSSGVFPLLVKLNAQAEAQQEDLAGD